MTLRRYFGTITTWYLQSHRTWDRFCHSCIGSPSCPRGPSRRRSLCLLTERCTPDRSKLIGSHGQRPWLHDVVTAVAGRVILAVDGLQPDVGHEVLWVVRDVLTGTVLLARSLLSSTQDDLAKLIG